MFRLHVSTDHGGISGYLFISADFSWGFSAITLPHQFSADSLVMLEGFKGLCSMPIANAEKRMVFSLQVKDTNILITNFVVFPRPN